MKAFNRPRLMIAFALASLTAAFGLAACAPAGGPQLRQDAQAPPAQRDVQPGGGTYRPPSSGAGVRSQLIVPGRPARVFIFAGVDSACKPLPAPTLTITRAPGKGDVSFRPGQSTKIAASTGGTCLGVSATGTGVYYTAHAGTSGADSFSVTARLAGGEAMVRDFAVQIAE